MKISCLWKNKFKKEYSRIPNLKLKEKNKNNIGVQQMITIPLFAYSEVWTAINNISKPLMKYFQNILD
jgi:hypothetical protein